MLIVSSNRVICRDTKNSVTISLYSILLTIEREEELVVSIKSYGTGTW